MVAWRSLAIAVIFLGAVQMGRAQTYSLSETPQVGDCYRLRLELKLAGDIKIYRDGKPGTLKLTATAEHEFPERILSVDTTGLPNKSARVYEKALAVIAVNGDKSERQLRPERRLIVAQHFKDQALTYSPAGPLTRAEIELISEHFDTLALVGLLSGKPVAIGDTWKVNNAVAQSLCNFEGLTEHSLVCKLEQVTQDVAEVSVAGAATGIELGALVKLKIDAVYQYDLKARRLTRLIWKQHDVRDQGPASPATVVDSSITLTRAAIEQPAVLANEALVSIPDGFEPPVPLTQLEYHDARARYDMLYNRDWQIVSETEDHLVLRLIERGDFVAQATITPWTKAEKGKHITADEFRQAMNETNGWEVEQELQAEEVASEGGRWVYRISALGQLDGAKVMQSFYLVAGPNGDQVVVVFTLTPKQAERLGTRDLSMAANIDFPSSRKN